MSSLSSLYPSSLIYTFSNCLFLTMSCYKFRSSLKAVLEEHVIEWKVNNIQSLLAQSGSELRSPFTASAVLDDCFYYMKLQPVPGGEKIGLFTIYFLTRCYRDVELEVNCKCEVLTKNYVLVAGGLQMNGKSPQRPVNCNFRLDKRDDESHQVFLDDRMIIRAKFVVCHGTPDRYQIDATTVSVPRRGAPLQTDLHRSSSVKLPPRANPMYPQELRRPNTLFLQEENRRPTSMILLKPPGTPDTTIPNSDFTLPPLDVSVNFNSDRATTQSSLTDLFPFNPRNVSPHLIPTILAYIATNEVPDIDDSAEELLKVASKYGMTDLKRKCAVSLWKNVTDENAVDLYFIAEKFNCGQLLKRLASYISVDPKNRLANRNKSSLPPDLKKMLESNSCS